MLCFAHSKPCWKHVPTAMGPVGCSWLSLLIDQCHCCVKGKLLYSQSITALMINKVIGEILEHRPTDKNSSTGTSTRDLPDYQRYEKQPCYSLIMKMNTWCHQRWSKIDQELGTKYPISHG